MSSNLVRLLMCVGGVPQELLTQHCRKTLAVFLAHRRASLGICGAANWEGAATAGITTCEELSLGYVSPKGSLTCLPHQPVPGVPHTL